MEELLPHLLKAYWQTARRKSISLQTSRLEDDEYEDGVRYWSQEPTAFPTTGLQGRVITR